MIVRIGSSNLEDKIDSLLVDTPVHGCEPAIGISYQDGPTPAAVRDAQHFYFGPQQKKSKPSPFNQISLI